MGAADVQAMPAPSPASRPIGAPLMIGLIVLPLLFVWLLLRPGYARGTVAAAFACAMLLPLLRLIVWLGERLMHA